MTNPQQPAPQSRIITVPNMRVPEQGAQAVAFTLDFTGANVTAIDISLQAAFDSGEFDYAQTIFIDNSNNPAAFTLIVPGTGQTGQAIIAAAFTQGYYPISPAMGAPQFVGMTANGVKVPVIFYNVPFAYFVWGVGGPGGIGGVGGVVNAGFLPTVLAAGNNTLVAAVPGQSVKLWRGQFQVDAPAVLKWTDGAGGTVLFSASLAALGSATFILGTLPHMVTTIGNALILNSSAIANMYGGMGTVQS